MARFQVQTPGGIVEVTADSESKAIEEAKANWQSLPKLISQNEEKLRIFERPGGQRYAVSPGFSTSNPEAIDRLMQGAKVADLMQESKDVGLLQRNLPTARLQEFVRGVPFVGSGFDELAGAVGGPEAQERSRELSEAMGRQRPGETMALNLAGGATTGAGIAAAAPRALSAAGQAVMGAGSRVSQLGRAGAVGTAVGAAEGGAYGYGEGTTPEERMQSAGSGAAFGGTFGGLLGAGGGVISDAAKNVIGRFKRSDVRTIAQELGVSTDAAKMIKTVFDQGGDIEAAQEALRRAGSEGMLADAGPAARALLDASAALGGRAGQQTRTAINERMARTRQSLESTLDTALGPAPVGPRTAVTEIAARSAPQRAQAYADAYSQPINYAAESGRRIEEIIGRMPPNIVNEAVTKANQRMAWEGRENMQIMADIADDGTITFLRPPNVEQLDILKQQLQNIAYSNSDDFGRLNADGRLYNNMASELRNAIGDAVPEYRNAVKLGGDKISEERAFALGRNMLRSQVELEDVIDEFADASADQIAAGKAGLRSYISKTLDDVRAIASDPGADALQARQVIQAVRDISSNNSRAKIRALMEEEADTLLDQVDEAAQSAVVRADLARNSMTASRLSVSSAAEDITAPGIKRLLEQGEFPEATKEMIRAITGTSKEYSEAQRQKLFTDVARALTEKRGPEAQIALRVLDQAIQGQALTESQTEELARLIGVALFSATTPAATRGAMTEERAAQ